MTLLALALAIAIVETAGASPVQNAPPPPPADAVLPMLEVDTFTPRAGEALDLRLHLPTGEDWREAHIGRCIARSGGRQWTVVLPEAVAEPEAVPQSVPFMPRSVSVMPLSVSVTFDQPGPAVILLSAGPAAAKGRSDSWQRTPYCAKAVVNVQPAADDPQDPREAPHDMRGAPHDMRGAPHDMSGAPLDPRETPQDPRETRQDPRLMPQAAATGKSGQKIEIMPMFEPTSLRAGDYLPLRLYVEGEKVAGAQVRAFRAIDGGVYEPAPPAKPTDAVGTTNQLIDREGSWLIRLEHVAAGTTWIADLTFQVYR